MNIGIDGNEANVTHPVGSNIYASQIIKYLHRLLGTKPYAQHQAQVYLKSRWQTLFPKKTPSWQYHIFGPTKLWTQWRLPLKLYTNQVFSSTKLDVFFTPGHYAPRFSPIPSVISIMDLAFFRFPQEFRSRDLKQLHAWTKYSVTNARHIFAISHSTKQDIIKYYDYPPDQITVTHISNKKIITKPLNQKENSYKLMQAHLGIRKPYFLYLGTLQPRKNISRLIDAFISLKATSNYQSLKLVIAGKKGWLYQEMFNKVKEAQLYDQVIFTGYVSEYEKYELIRHSQALVLPSLYEGFGIPVLEAMKIGTPVIISKVSSLPEVGGDHAIYISDPTQTEQITAALVKVLQLSQGKREEIIRKNKQQAQQFTWANCAQQTLDTLLQLQTNI